MIEGGGQFVRECHITITRPLLVKHVIVLLILVIINTRPKPAYGRQGLDWFVGPGYSFVVFSTNREIQLTSLIQKSNVTNRGVQLTSFDPKM